MAPQVRPRRNEKCYLVDDDVDHDEGSGSTDSGGAVDHDRAFKLRIKVISRLHVIDYGFHGSNNGRET